MVFASAGKRGKIKQCENFHRVSLSFPPNFPRVFGKKAKRDCDDQVVGVCFFFLNIHSGVNFPGSQEGCDFSFGGKNQNKSELCYFSLYKTCECLLVAHFV